MTTLTRSLAPDALSGGLALRRLVAGDLEDFARSTWGREPLLSSRSQLSQGFEDLLDADAVDELVSQRGLRTPFLRVARAGATLPERDFTASGGVGASIADQISDDRLAQLFADGATMVLQGLHRIWPPLIAFTQQLAADLGHPVQANAYVTPPQSQGFDDHYDVHDVFVLQVAGEKRWRIRPPVHPLPLRDQPWTDRRADVESAARHAPLIDVVLRPGDCLYLPRGYLHAATALGGVSTHLTLGVHTWTRYTLADELVRAALAALADDERVRGSLPLGVGAAVASGVPGVPGVPGALDDEVAMVRDRLLAAVRDVSPAAVTDQLAARVRSSQRAAPMGPLAQLRASSTLTVGDVLVLRTHVLAEVATDADRRLFLRSRAGDLPLTSAEALVVRALLDEGSLTVDEACLDLARRLVAAGVLTTSPAGAPTAAPVDER